MKKLIALSFIALFLAGCNTVSGFGKDVQKVGSKMEGAAKK
jgi:predicted small secreted protein